MQSWDWHKNSKNDWFTDSAYLRVDSPVVNLIKLPISDKIECGLPIARFTTLPDVLKVTCIFSTKNLA